MPEATGNYWVWEPNIGMASFSQKTGNQLGLGFKYAILCWQNRWLTQDMFMRRKAPVATWFHQINPSVLVMLKFDLADTNPRCYMMLPTAKQLWYPNSPNSSWSFRRRMKTGSPVFTPRRTDGPMKRGCFLKPSDTSRFYKFERAQFEGPRLQIPTIFRCFSISMDILQYFIYVSMYKKKQIHSNSTSLLLCCLQSLNPLSSPHDLQSHFVILGFTALVDYKLRESLAVESLAHFSKARKSEKIREKWYSYIMLMLQESLPTEFLHVAGSSAWPALAGFIEIRLAAITKWTVTFYQLLPVR